MTLLLQMNSYQIELIPLIGQKSKKYLFVSQRRVECAIKLQSSHENYKTKIKIIFLTYQNNRYKNFNHNTNEPGVPNTK